MEKLSTGGHKCVPGGDAELDRKEGREIVLWKKMVFLREEVPVMSGPKPNYPICLTEEEVKQFQKQVRAHKTGQDLVVRAKLLLVANEHPEWSNPQIAEAVGTTDRTVRKWRGR